MVRGESLSSPSESVGKSPTLKSKSETQKQKGETKMKKRLEKLANKVVRKYGFEHFITIAVFKMVEWFE